MTKYNIEGNIDFFSELYKSFDNEEKNDENINLCLITDEPLIDKFIKLECNHNFNYIPLYLDIKNHKQKFNFMEGNSSKLNNNEIRCPYCRKKHVGLLPFYEELGLAKVHGVNFIDPNFKSSTAQKKSFISCQFLTPNEKYDPSGNNPEEINLSNFGNCKFHQCFNSGTPFILYNNSENQEVIDDKNYCWKHKKEIVKKYNKDNINKEKLKQKEEKIKQKEETKLKQKEEKLKQKKEKQKSKEDKKQKNVSENVVLGPSIITDMSGNKIFLGCVEILKSGPNKGNTCGCKIVSENMCKRHFMLNHKELILHNK